MANAALTGKMNMHHLLTAFPLGTGQVEGGLPTELLHLTEVFLFFFFSVSLWDKDQKRPMKIEQNRWEN